jgi:hypothetical protein
MYSNMVGSFFNFSLCKSIGFGVCFLSDHDILMQPSDPDENSEMQQLKLLIKPRFN